ncbi:tetratricopeptide repeat protein [Sphingomonas gilva]|nr:tetratricopeptide repeat protein [Sphingomonas gilva]
MGEKHTAWLAVLAALVLAPPAAASPREARAALARSVAAFRAGDLTRARDAAEAAARSEPRAGLAHAMVARMALGQGDGVAAEAALDRAEKVGFPKERALHLRAHARLLQGDGEGALALARDERVPARYRAYAARIEGRAMVGTGAEGAGAAFVRAVRLAPADSLAWSDLARFRLVSNDSIGAAAAVDRAITLDPANREALILKGELFRTQYGLAASLPWFEAAIDLDPGNGPALIEYAATLGDMGRYTEMLAASRRAAAIRGSTAQALYLQAVLAARARNYDLARALIQRTGGAMDGFPAALLLRGGLDYHAGAFAQAVERLGRLVEMQPDNADARRLLGAALLGANDAQGAVDALQPLIARRDADSYALTVAARAFERLGDRDAAGALLDRAARPVRDVADDGWAGGDALVAEGRYREAADAFARDANARFDEAAALRLVDALDRAGARIEAQRVLSLFLQQNPRNVAALKVAANWQIAAKDWAGAVRTLEVLRQRLGNRDAALLSQLAWAHAGAGKPERALIYARAAYELAPASPIAADTLGVLLARTPDRRADGIALLQKAALLAPDNAAIAAHLAAAKRRA